MKNSIFLCYLPHFLRTGSGERYSTILRYFFPEVVTAFLLYSALALYDSWLIGDISCANYAILGVTNRIIHTLVKLAEGFSVGSTVLTGRFNSMQSYRDVGRTAHDTFWLTIMLGLVVAGLLYGGAYFIYVWFGVNEAMISFGIPFLRLRSISIFLSFIYLGLVGFLRGIKNTTVPMQSFILGSIVFVTVDYLFVPGNFGFARLGLQGSALASIAQNCAMLLLVVAYILFSQETRKYMIALFKPIQKVSYFVQLIVISLPVAVDKVVFAFSYMWLHHLICVVQKLIDPTQQQWIATFNVVHDIEKVAIVPAIALAQVITLLVSNDFKKGDWTSIKSNIRKVMIIAFCAVVPLLILFCCLSPFIFSIWDREGVFAHLAVRVFPAVSVLVLLDLIQLIFSGALRGAGDVRTVMWVRIILCICYFVPISYVVTNMVMTHPVIKFVLLYSLFYLGHGIMALLYIMRIYSKKWNKFLAKEAHEKIITDS